jgi:hypothetical protein
LIPWITASVTRSLRLLRRADGEEDQHVRREADDREGDDVMRIGVLSPRASGRLLPKSFVRREVFSRGHGKESDAVHLWVAGAARARKHVPRV